MQPCRDAAWRLSATLYQGFSVWQRSMLIPNQRSWETLGNPDSASRRSTVLGLLHPCNFQDRDQEPRPNPGGWALAAKLCCLSLGRGRVRWLRWGLGTSSEIGAHIYELNNLGNSAQVLPFIVKTCRYFPTSLLYRQDYHEQPLSLWESGYMPRSISLMYKHPPLIIGVIDEMSLREKKSKQHPVVLHIWRVCLFFVCTPFRMKGGASTVFE